jgi:Uma2 family endonuclease
MVLPETSLRSLLTVDDYARLGEDDRQRWELQEGSLVMSPSPTARHMAAMLELAVQLRRQLPVDLRLVPDVDLDLQLAAPDQPGWSRRPDLVVVEAAAFARATREGGLLRADETRLVVEIISPGARRMDLQIKRAEYADAGIPHYWIVDLEPPTTLTGCHLAGEFGYRDDGQASGLFTTSEPFPVRVDLTALA